MATCNDCIHSGVCAIQLEPHYILDRAQKLMRESDNVEHECLSFKECSRFVELPCKVGDTIYVFENIAGEKKIIQDTVETIDIGYYGDGIEIYQFTGIKTHGYFSDFGKTVFLTKKQAEQALKERESSA